MREIFQQDLPLEMKLWIFVPRSHPSIGLRHYSTCLHPFQLAISSAPARGIRHLATTLQQK